MLSAHLLIFIGALLVAHRERQEMLPVRCVGLNIHSYDVQQRHSAAIGLRVFPYLRLHGFPTFFPRGAAEFELLLTEALAYEVGHHFTSHGQWKHRGCAKGVHLGRDTLYVH